METASPDIVLPSPPEILTQLADVKGDINAVGRIIGDDKELAKEVLDTINAPYFSLVREIKSTEEAARMLGMNRVVNLTTGRLLKGTLFKSRSKLNNDIWATSMKVAVISVLVSQEFDKATTDQAYTTALFHNSGMALMNEAVPDYLTGLKTAYHAETSNITDSENQHFGVNHAAISAQLAGNWGLSGAMSKCIHWHHTPSKAIKLIEKQDEAGELLLILKISEHLARLPGYLTQCVQDFEWELIKEAILDELQLTEGMFRRIEVGIKKKLAEIKS